MGVSIGTEVRHRRDVRYRGEGGKRISKGGVREEESWDGC